MKKYLFFLFIIIKATQISAMDKKTKKQMDYFQRLDYYFSRKNKWKPQKITEIEKNGNELGILIGNIIALRGEENYEFIGNETDDDTRQSFLALTYFVPTEKKFLSHYNYSWADMVKAFESNPELLHSCQQAQINGYSALGITVSSGTPPRLLKRKGKKKTIQKLTELGFKPTEKDYEIAYLELWHRTPLDTKRKLLLLAGQTTDKEGNLKNPKSPFSKLPLEIIRDNIAPYITSEEPLLSQPTPSENEN